MRPSDMFSRERNSQDRVAYESSKEAVKQKIIDYLFAKGIVRVSDLYVEIKEFSPNVIALGIEDLIINKQVLKVGNKANPQLKIL